MLISENENVRRSQIRDSEMLYVRIRSLVNFYGFSEVWDTHVPVSGAPVMLSKSYHALKVETLQFCYCTIDTWAQPKPLNRPKHTSDNVAITLGCSMPYECHNHIALDVGFSRIYDLDFRRQEYRWSNRVAPYERENRCRAFGWREGFMRIV